MKHKKLLILVISLLLSHAESINSQNSPENSVTEHEYIAMWQGILKAGEAKFRMVFKFYKTGNDSVTAALDIPEQRASGIKATEVFFGTDSIYVGIASIDGYYSGKFSSDKTIEGEWVQGGNRFPMVMERIERVTDVKHPQEPKRPFPYNEEEVTFENKKAGITLSGTFTYPYETNKASGGKGFPVVVLVSGSGPQTRDEEVFGHKAFLVWSDHLTRNGIAVLRYDDRGFGKSTGDFGSATTMDFCDDAMAAVNYIKNRNEIDPERIGIIGHSEGAVIAPIAANKCKDISFIVLAAGPAVSGEEIVLLQSELILRKQGAPEAVIKTEKENNKNYFEILKNAKDSEEASVKLDSLFNITYGSLPESEKNGPGILQTKRRLLSPWFGKFLVLDPRNELTKLNIPVLAMYGENDLQVPPSQNKSEMEKALEKSESKKFKVVVFPSLNHIFQESESGLPTEYGNIEQTTSPKMLDLMANWIKEI